MDLVAAAADLIAATVLAMRADSGAARTHADKALATRDQRKAGCSPPGPAGPRIAALTDGSHLLAFTQLRQLFSEEGAPVHHIFSYLGVADLAAPAVRADRGWKDATSSSGRQPSRRSGFARPSSSSPAPAASSRPGRGRSRFRQGAPRPRRDQWPFERAAARLDYADRLRRRRRINDAKPS